MIRFLSIALGILLLAAPAQATPIIADLSNYRIDVDSSFNGTRLFLFGARNDYGDVVAVIRGPQKSFMVRKKEQIAGIWVNSDRMRFWNIPAFYAVAASKPLSEIPQDLLFRQLGIGQNQLLSPPADPIAKIRFDEFSTAFLNHLHASKLYTTNPVAMQFMGETLFKSTIEFPDNIPPGNYTAEVYLISDGNIVGMQSTPITVVKTGLDAFLYRYAHDFPFLYGITAIVMALGAGWFAGRLFQKI